MIVLLGLCVLALNTLLFYFSWNLGVAPAFELPVLDVFQAFFFMAAITILRGDGIKVDAKFQS